MNEYQIAIISGGFIAVFIVVAHIICWVGVRVWAWIDDSEIIKASPIIKFIMKLCGYKYRPDLSEIFPYHKFHNEKKYEDAGYRNKDKYLKSKSDGTLAFLSTLLLSVVPLMSMVSVKYIYISIPIISLVLLAHLARFARRHKKLFDKHIKDKDAHK